MPNTANGKLKLLYILEYIKAKSDENTPVSTCEIAAFLRQKGLNAERKSIYDSINALKDYGCDIIRVAAPRKGFCLLTRDFEQAEILLLTDAVQSAGFISRKKSERLIQKLTGLLSENEAALIKNRVFISDRNKGTNEELYYNIDKISRAVAESKMIRFNYIRHKFDAHRITLNSRELTVSPYAIIWASDHYYLIGNVPKYDNLVHLRLDRIKSVEILPENSRHFSEVSEYKTVFDSADYSKKSFNMFGGEPCEVIFKCDKSLLDQVIDRFGENIHMRNVSEDKFTFDVTVLVSEGLMAWIMQYGDGIEVRRPLELRRTVRERIEHMQALYAE